MALLTAVLDVAQHEFSKPAPKWRTRRLSREDMDFLDKECMESSEFDPREWRRDMVRRYKRGGAHVEVRDCSYGSVIAIGHEHGQIPWGLWGRILRLYKGQRPARIFLLANPYVRTFPKGKQAIGPEHINGGYTYPCNNETIIVYRAEDATRVLIHELQHASCLDHMEKGVDKVEAETEAWAELLYVALLSQGNRASFNELLARQVAWMKEQNMTVKRHLKDGPFPFPWRYTLGKEEVWMRWGIMTTDTVTHPWENMSPTTSLRLTAPPKAELQHAFGVHQSNLL